MREHLWDLLWQMKYRQIYMIEYRKITQTIKTIISVICVLFTSTAVMDLAFWDHFPRWREGLICIVAIYELIKPLLPYEAHLNGLHYFIPEMDMMLIELEAEFQRLSNSTDDEAIRVACEKYKKQYALMDNKYLPDLNIPDFEPLANKVKEKCEQLFTVYYLPDEGGK